MDRRIIAFELPPSIFLGVMGPDAKLVKAFGRASLKEGYRQVTFIVRANSSWSIDLKTDIWSIFRTPSFIVRVTIEAWGKGILVQLPSPANQ